MFKIEKGIPLPSNDSLAFFMRSMEVGDSFIAATGDKEAIQSNRNRVSNSMQILGRSKKDPKKYISKVLPIGNLFELRVWRVK